jgi:uracil-DNA glycosylase
MRLQELESISSACTLCELCKGRNKPVFARGSIDTDIVICGMCPGPDENEVGSPFVGRAGKILDEVIEHASIGAPELLDVYITNLVKCYVKPGIELDQVWMDACLPYFIVQLKLINPKVIIALGKDVSNYLLGTKLEMKDMRGKAHDYIGGMKIVSCYHPAFIVRSGGIVSKYFGTMVEDFKLAYASR